MKAHRVSKNTTPLILNIGTRHGSVANFILRMLYPTERTCQYPLSRRLGRHQNWSGHFRKEKNLWPLPGFKLYIIQPIP